MTGGAALAAGAATGGAAGFAAGILGFTEALAFVVFFGTTACFLGRAGFVARAFGLLARAAPFAGAARRVLAGKKL